MSQGPGIPELIQREVLAALVVRARGRRNALKLAQLAALVGNGLRERGHDHAMGQSSLRRRCREAVAALVALGERIGSATSGPAGYFYAEDLEELAAGARTLRRNLVGAARRYRAYDAATSEAILRALGQEPLPLPKAAPPAAEGP